MSQKSVREQATGKAVLDSRKLKQLYSTMLKCRMIQERVGRAFPRSAAGRHSFRALGQEAAEVGAAMDLFRDDFVVPLEREWVFHFTQGEQLQSVFKGLRAPNTSAPSTVINLQSPATERLSLATGAALACQWHKQSGVILAFATEDLAGNDFPHPVLEFAGQHKLPIVYVIQRRRSAKLAKRSKRITTAHDYGMPSILVDGNDVVAVYRVAQEAIRRAREGHGPAVIHCHNIGSGDPLAFMEHYLKRKRLWSDAWKKKTVKSFHRELDKAVTGARKSH